MAARLVVLLAIAARPAVVVGATRAGLSRTPARVLRMRACAAPSAAAASASAMPDTPRAALRGVLGAIDAALSDGRAGLCLDVRLPGLVPMSALFAPDAVALLALQIADALHARQAAGAAAAEGAPPAGPVRLVCSPPAVLDALERRLRLRAAAVALDPSAPAAPTDDGVPTAAPAGCVVASIVGDDAVPLGGIEPNDGAVVFVCPCALDADECSPIWPIREAMREARRGRRPAGAPTAPATGADDEGAAAAVAAKAVRPVVVLNSAFYAQPSELRGFEQAYLCRAVDELPASRGRAADGAALAAAAGGAARGGGLSTALAGSGSGALLPGAGWDTPQLDGLPAMLPELALVRAYPGPWTLHARARNADGSSGDGGWEAVEARQARPDGKQLSLMQVQLGYAAQRRVQLAAAAATAALTASADAAAELTPAAAAQSQSGVANPVMSYEVPSLAPAHVPCPAPGRSRALARARAHAGCETRQDRPARDGRLDALALHAGRHRRARRGRARRECERGAHRRLAQRAVQHPPARRLRADRLDPDPVPSCARGLRLPSGRQGPSDHHALRRRRPWRQEPESAPGHGLHQCAQRGLSRRNPRRYRQVNSCTRQQGVHDVNVLAVAGNGR
jgi:hypothetical protein